MTEAGIALRLSVPSKSFFLGEYLALTGGRTLLAATLPRFELPLDGRGENLGKRHRRRLQISQVTRDASDSPVSDSA